MKLVTGLMDRLLFAAGLLLFMQIPQFVDHYTQRFGGYQQALADSVAAYQSSADAHYGGDLSLMIHDFEADPKPASRELGRKMEAERTRLARMTRGLETLRYGSLPAKLVYLAGDLDTAIARATLEAFKPGLPLTLDALLCGLVGGILASALFNLLLWPLRAALERRRMLRI